VAASGEPTGRAGATERVEAAGIVREQLPNAMFRVEIDGRRSVLAHMSAGAGRNFIRVLVGDRVVVELMAGDPTRGRIARVER
jgi:translation initiation factor IF-1